MSRYRIASGVRRRSTFRLTHQGDEEDYEVVDGDVIELDRYDVQRFGPAVDRLVACGTLQPVGPA